MLYLLIILAILCIPSIAFAQPNPATDPQGFGQAFLDAFNTNNWTLVAALGIVLATVLIRRFGSHFGLGSGKAAVAVSLGLGAVSALASGLYSGTVTDIKSGAAVLIGGLATSFMASGIYSQTKALKKKNSE